MCCSDRFSGWLIVLLHFATKFHFIYFSHATIFIVFFRCKILLLLEACVCVDTRCVLFRRSLWQVWFSRGGMPSDMTNLSVVNMNGRIVVSPLRPTKRRASNPVMHCVSSQESTSQSQPGIAPAEQSVGGGPQGGDSRARDNSLPNDRRTSILLVSSQLSLS